MEVLSWAFRHGVTADAMLHALSSALAVEELEEDPTRYLVLGPDPAGNMLELVVLDRAEGPALIDAMPMRAKFRSLLEGGRRS